MSVSVSSERSMRGCLALFLPLVFALGATAVSANRQFPEEPSCGGMLGAGFPVLFICDDWGGGSPTSSWERIDLVDVLNGGIKPGSFLVDLLFYTVLAWAAWLLLAVLLHRGAHPVRIYSWAALLSIGYLAGLLTGFMIFRPGGLTLEHTAVRTPTPVMPSPTPLEFSPAPPTPVATPAVQMPGRNVFR